MLDHQDKYMMKAQILPHLHVLHSKAERSHSFVHLLPWISYDLYVMEMLRLIQAPKENITQRTYISRLHSDPWILFTDGSSCTDGFGAGLILTNPEGMVFTYALRFRFNATNNEAEYEALIAGLRIAEQMGVKNLQANVDSRLVANQANYVLRKIHEGSCSMHAGTRSVVAKSLRTGYYWPTMHRDARTLIRACQDCQVYKPVPRNPQQKLTPITSPWLFYKWGIDIAGPFPEGPGKVKFLIVSMDYFIKWIEAKPVATITSNQFKIFIWDNVVCSLGEGIKARLDARSKNWIEELPHVLWAHRTMIKSSNEDTPCSLTYGTKAVISIEIGMPTLRIAEVDQVGNNEALEINLDLLKERIRGGRDLLYRNNDASRVEDTGKLGPKWEGPYEVTEALGKGAYKLRGRDGKQLPRTWNISNLKKCHIHKM
nr:reverse transcriptase domain-containing protein [Tanacetum cinerariifolium]